MPNMSSFGGSRRQTVSWKSVHWHHPSRLKLFFSGTSTITKKNQDCEIKINKPIMQSISMKIKVLYSLSQCIGRANGTKYCLKVKQTS